MRVMNQKEYTAAGLALKEK
jgi:hypothetical protein